MAWCWFLRLQFILSDIPLFAAGLKIFYALLCVLHATKVATILVSYLTYDPAGYALPILSAVDYVVVAAGYLCLAQQTVYDSRFQLRLVRAVYSMFGFCGLLATVAAIGILCRAWGLSQEDGGVRANNPMGIAQEECRTIWPSRRTHDLLVSVGTGYTPGTEGTGDPPGRRFPAGWGPVRLCRTYNSPPCMDGMEAYREGRVHVASSLRSNTIRLDDGPVEPVGDNRRRPRS
ncbi:hypothetical protein CBS147333_9914 [Penicillium roqueforti]|nr:hypothetical protein CBS147333_9914 [Penicillium roqueforti]KAI3190928.1 hypothetical protein CBS147311_9670 [Penicillium roqueforti]KAI3283642.1 hypothetical protein DTO003C3_8403 [Penicillium roqueforti]